MQTVNLDLTTKSYNIKIGSKIINYSNLEKFVSNKEVLLIHDSAISGALIIKFKKLINEETLKLESIKINANEQNKSQETLSKIHSTLIENKFSRDCLIIGLGGGIVCDISGFAAATYQRGVDFFLIPTTLLSQVDASVGGKTAINHPKGKNMIGAFHQPLGVLADLAFLSTLPKREISCGLSEMIKHGLIRDIGYFSWLEENIEQIIELDSEITEEAISRSIKIKAEIVREDEKEKSIRALLNFGHTFGHALELIGDFKNYNHGEAVAIGMIMALEMSVRIGNITQQDCERVKQLFNRAKIDTKIRKTINSLDLYECMLGDKKKRGNVLNLVVLENLGRAKSVKGIEKSLILEIIDSCL
jgi:3-dehydroquinate synthase